MSRKLRQALARIEDVRESQSAFKEGTGYWVNGKEVAHFETDNILDIRLTRAGIRERRAELKADPRVRLRASGSDWLAVEIQRPADVAFVVELMEAAAAAHRAPPGAIADPPPEGADLQRRRRFH